MNPEDQDSADDTRIGRFNRLRVIREVDFGVYLDGVDLVDILLPRRYVPAGCQVGDDLDVFVYVDSSDRLVATTERPRVQVGECASLKVVAVNDVGAFLDWGLSKDLLVPYSEQFRRMEEGKYYTVFVYCDEETGRIAASSKLGKYLHEKLDLRDTTPALRPHQPVNLLVAAKTDLGYKAVVDNRYLGMIFHSDVLQPLPLGRTVPGFIKAVRADGKIDLCLQLQTHEKRMDLADRILAHLEANEGVSTLTDKSRPEDIYRTYQVSKGSYKKSIGYLFKHKKIVIEQDRIVLGGR